MKNGFGLVARKKLSLSDDSGQHASAMLSYLTYDI